MAKNLKKTSEKNHKTIKKTQKIAKKIVMTLREFIFH